jgi:hypothetical protein
MSHFTTVKTKINDLVCLRLALKDLNLAFTESTVDEKCFVKGYQKQKAEADMVIHVSKTYDVGVVVTPKGIKLVADWWGVEVTRGLNEQEFVHLVTQKYAYHKVKQELQKKGYTLAKEEVKEDTSIHIKLKKF